MKRRQLIALAILAPGAVAFPAKAEPFRQLVEQCAREQTRIARAQSRGWPTMAVVSVETGIVRLAQAMLDDKTREISRVLGPSEVVPWIPPVIELDVSRCPDSVPGGYFSPYGNAERHGRPWKDHGLACPAAREARPEQAPAHPGRIAQFQHGQHRIALGQLDPH